MCIEPVEMLYVTIKSGENQGLLYKIQYHSNWMAVTRKDRIVKSYLLHFTQPAQSSECSWYQ